MMKNRTLGPWQVSAIGLGCMNISRENGPATDPLRRIELAIPAIHAALDAGITLLDTADIYAPAWSEVGHNETLVGEALYSWSGTPEQKAKVIVATKNGITRQPGEKWGRNSTLDYLLRASEASLARLGTDQIDLWQHHRLDPTIPFELQFENVLVLRDRGIINQIGVSNYNIEQLKVAIKMGGSSSVGGIISVQNQYSPRYRNDFEIFAFCEANNLAFLPWSPLAGMNRSAEINEGKLGAFAQVGAAHGVSPFVVTIAWHLRISKNSIPIPGATRVESVLDSVKGIDLELTDLEFDTLNASLLASDPMDYELIDQPAFRAWRLNFQSS